MTVRLFALSAFFVLFRLALSQAEVLRLKSGQKIEGKITEEAKDYIKIDFQGINLTYFKTDLEKVDRVPQESSLDDAEKKKLHGQALLFFQKQDYDKAIEYLQQSLKIDPHYMEANYALGMVYRAKGDEAKAMDYLLKAYSLDSKSKGASVPEATLVILKTKQAEVYFNQGVYFLKTNNFVQAVKSFKKCIDLDSTRVFTNLAYCNIGYIYNQQAKFNQALKYLKEGLEINPQDADIYASLGDAYAGLNRTQEADKSYKKSIELFNKQGQKEKAQQVASRFALKPGQELKQ